jgi:tRNA modification GTPase
MNEFDAIVAVATPHGKSALAVIRISGSTAIEIGAAIIREKKLFIEAPTRYINVYSAVDPTSGTSIDEITAIKYAAPKSFTGENMVEIFCHGSPMIIRKILGVIFRVGARMAMRGEFTRRALLNNKINLLRAEAIGGLIECESEEELACAQKLYEKGVKDFILWKERIVEILSEIETHIEFGEDDAGGEIGDHGKKELEKFTKEIACDLNKKEKINRVAGRQNVVIGGPANAGKSTLFNKILGFDRAIVHDEPGTTRDLVSERVWIGNHEVELIDSAGLRETGNPVEQEGIVRSKNAIGTSAITIWVTSADEKVYEWEEKMILETDPGRSIYVINKCDKNPGEEKRQFFEKSGRTSLRAILNKGEMVDTIIEAISSLQEKLADKIILPDIFFNSRHELIGRELLNELNLANKNICHYEIAAFHLNRGLSLIDQLIGKTDAEEIMNRIFEKFCIGK